MIHPFPIVTDAAPAAAVLTALDPSRAEIPRGLCQCGCGQIPPLAARTYRSLGLVKGQPRRFLTGHRRRKAPYVIDANGCWIWTGELNHAGYGIVRRPEVFGRKRVRAHRAFYEALVGPIPEGLHLDHLCRVPACVNPSHLEPVTIAENTRRGNLTKLTPADVLSIRASDEASSALALRYGISGNTIRGIRNGSSWTYLLDRGECSAPALAASPPLPFVGAAGTPSESDAERRADWRADADREEQERMTDQLREKGA